MVRQSFGKLTLLDLKFYTEPRFFYQLLSAMFTAQFLSLITRCDKVEKHRLNKYVNLIYRHITMAECGLIISGTNFAFGGSRPIVAGKIN
jgi:hypothetical protein